MVVKPASERVRRRDADPAHQAWVDAVPLPAILLDAEGRIQAINPAWRDAARPGAMLDPADGVGANYLQALRDNKGFESSTGRALADALTPVLEGDAEHAEHGYGLAQEPHIHWVAQASRVEFENAQLVLLVQRESTKEDRSSSLAERVGRLMMEVEHLTAVAQDRARLLAAAEQSFHAPLTPIRLQLHLLRNGALGDLNDRQVAAIERIDRNVKRWWQLQERLMADLDGLEAKNEEMELADAARMTKEALQPFHERAIKAGIKLRVDIDSVDMHCMVEERALVQGMMLILDHAIRQTPSGGQVWARLRPNGEDIEFIVHDQDPEIEPETADALLSPDGAESSLRSGLMHIQSVMSRHRGDIQAVCHGAGRGLEVTLQWPRVRRSTRNRGASKPGEATHYA